MANRDITYSLVIPAYHEGKILGSSLESVYEYLKARKRLTSTEVIVVAADAGDETAEIAKSFKKQFKHFLVLEPGAKVGKGRDVKLGMTAARGKYIAFTDADLATPLHHLDELWGRLESGADVVVGVRNLRTIHTGYRIAVSVCSNWLTRLIVLPGAKDTQCGFKGFRRPVAKKLFTRQSIQGWGFDIELLVIARTLKYRIDTIAIPDWFDPKLDEGLVGESGVSAITSTLAELLRIKYRQLRQLYR